MKTYVASKSTCCTYYMLCLLSSNDFQTQVHDIPHFDIIPSSNDSRYTSSGWALPFAIPYPYALLYQYTPQELEWDDGFTVVPRPAPGSEDPKQHWSAENRRKYSLDRECNLTLRPHLSTMSVLETPKRWKSGDDMVWVETLFWYRSWSFFSYLAYYVQLFRIGTSRE